LAFNAGMDRRSALTSQYRSQMDPQRSNPAVSQPAPQGGRPMGDTRAPAQRQGGDGGGSFYGGMGGGQRQQPAMGSAITSPGQSATGWNEAAPGARPQQSMSQQPQGQWGGGGTSAAVYNQHTSPGWNPNPGAQAGQMPDQAALAAAYAQAVANGGYGNRGPENVAYGNQMATQAPSMTTSVQPQRQQYQPPPSAAQQKYNSYQQPGPAQGAFSDPELTRMQGVNSQYQQPMMREANPRYSDPFAGYGAQQGRMEMMAKQAAMEARLRQGLGGIPRFAYGTDNSQQYQDNGLGGSWIPSSDNAHAQGHEIPPALQALINAGVPIPPSLLNGVTGGQSSPLNTGRGFTGLGGGVLPSLQGLDRMSTDEREVFSGYLTGPMGLPEASTIDGIGRPTQNLQRAAPARMG